MKTVLDESGRIELPEEVRSQMGLKPGDEVVLESREGQWVLRPSQRPAGLQWEGNVLVHHGTGGAVEEQLEAVRDERLARLAKGLSS